MRIASTDQSGHSRARVAGGASALSEDVASGLWNGFFLGCLWGPRLPGSETCPAQAPLGSSGLQSGHAGPARRGRVVETVAAACQQGCSNIRSFGSLSSGLSLWSEPLEGGAHLSPRRSEAGGPSCQRDQGPAHRFTHPCLARAPQGTPRPGPQSPHPGRWSCMWGRWGGGCALSPGRGRPGCYLSGQPAIHRRPSLGI